MKNDKIAGKQFTAPSTSPLTEEGCDIVSKNGEGNVRRGTMITGDVAANMVSAINSVENRRRSVVTFVLYGGEFGVNTGNGPK